MSKQTLSEMWDELPSESDTIKKNEGEYEYLHRAGHFDLRSPLRNQVEDAPRQAKEPTVKTGKIFQQLVVDSARKQKGSVTIDRLYDNGWHRNIGDYILQYKDKTCWMEAKSTDTSLAFDKKGIRQKKLLIEKSERSKVAGTREWNMVGVFVEFKRRGARFALWWVDIDDVSLLERTNGRKSFNPKDLERLWIESPMIRSYPVQLYKPHGRKDYIDIAGMMAGNEIDPDQVQLEEVN